MSCHEMLQPRKRTHNTHVCNFCKRRKVRCDKGTPCSACVKYGNPICEYPPENASRAPDRADRNEFGELVLQLSNGRDPAREPRKRGSTNSLSSSSSGSTAPTGGYDENYAPNMHSELEFLKSKISMLEHSISVKSVSNGAGSAVDPAQPTSPPWKSPSGNAADFQFMVGANPCLSDSQYFSFHNSYVPFVHVGTSSLRHYYPLSWISLIKMYSSVSPLFAMKQKKYFKERSAMLNADLEPSGPSDRVFNMKLREFVGDEGSYRKASPVKDDTKAEKLKKINQRAKAVGLTVFEGDLDSVHDVVDKALLLLPSRKVIWLLVDRFFERVYPFFPFLDQMELEDQMASILGSASRDHVRVDKLNIQKKIEIIHLGILLLVLRFSYLTLFTNDDALNEAHLFTNDPSERAQNLKFLMNNPIDVDVFGVAQMCLFQFGYLRYSNLPILQLCLYLKIYNCFAPENGEGADDSHSQGFCSRVIDMAMTLGLHREPENFRTKVRDERTNNLCRKIWWYLVIVDAIGGLTNGSPLSIKRSQFDTLPPFHKPGNENIKNTFLETQVVSSLANFDGCYDRIYDVVSVISDVRAPVSMRDLCNKLTALEIQSVDILEALLTSLNSTGSSVPHIEVANAHTLKIGFQATFFMVSVYLHFFNHYEKMDELDLAYFYLKKLLCVSMYNMMPFYDKFVENSTELFQNTTDIAITPSFQTLVHKCTIIIHCVEMRSRFSILKCEMSATHQHDLTDPSYKRRYELLKETFALCETSLGIFLRVMKKMMSRYYYCWRYFKAQEKMSSIRNGTEYYTTWCRGKESYMLLTSDMLEDLNGIMRKSILKVQKNETEAESVPDLSSVPPDGPDVNSTGTPAGNFDINDQFSNNMWTQMLSMKPDLGKTGVFNEDSPLNFPLDFADTGAAFDQNFFSDVNSAGTGFYDSILHDLFTQEPQI